ncbi:MAG: flagellin [Pseudomonadota bacterium]
MVSILNNESAAVALNTLREINRNLSQVQSEISTGQRIANARDNAAIFAVSSVIEADIESFRAISDSLNLGSSTVAVARTASEEITNLLTEIQSNVVAAQEDNVDRTLIQQDISNLRDQIASIVNAASFNGLNLLQGTENVDILSSLDRQTDQTVRASRITINRSDLQATLGVFNGSGTIDTTQVAGDTAGTPAATNAGTGLTTVTTATAGASQDIVFTDSDGGSPVAADGFDSDFAFTATVNGEVFNFDTTTSGAVAAANATQIAAEIDAQLSAFVADRGITGVEVTNSTGTLTVTNNNAFDTVSFQATTSATNDSADTNPDVTLASRGDQSFFDIAAGVRTGGEGFRLNFAGGPTVEFVARTGDDQNDIANGLAAALRTAAAGNPSFADFQVSVVEGTSGNPARLEVDNGNTAIAVTVETRGEGTQGGGLRDLATIDVSTAVGASNALDVISDLIQTGVQAAANFGSAERRIDIQDEFVTNLIDSLRAGVSALTDADLEEASARLQSLQVQQQLGIQALTIANQQPQALLGLFR